MRDARCAVRRERSALAGAPWTGRHGVLRLLDRAVGAPLFAIGQAAVGLTELASEQRREESLLVVGQVPVPAFVHFPQRLVVPLQQAGLVPGIVGHALDLARR